MNTRERLISATRQLLWDRGYSATSPAAIREIAKAGQSSMYHHFTDKHALAVAAFSETTADLRDAITEAVDGASPLESLRRYLQKPRDALRGCPVGRMSYDAETIEDPQLAAPLRETFEWLDGVLVELVRRAQGNGELPNDLPAETLASTIAATVQGGYVLARATGDPTALDRATQGALQLLDLAASTTRRH